MRCVRCAAAAARPSASSTVQALISQAGGTSATVLEICGHSQLQEDAPCSTTHLQPVNQKRKLSGKAAVAKKNDVHSQIPARQTFIQEISLREPGRRGSNQDVDAWKRKLEERRQQALIQLQQQQAEVTRKSNKSDMDFATIAGSVTASQQVAPCTPHAAHAGTPMQQGKVAAQAAVSSDSTASQALATAPDSSAGASSSQPSSSGAGHAAPEAAPTTNGSVPFSAEATASPSTSTHSTADSLPASSGGASLVLSLKAWALKALGWDSTPGQAVEPAPSATPPITSSSAAADNAAAAATSDVQTAHAAVRSEAVSEAAGAAAPSAAAAAEAAPAAEAAATAEAAPSSQPQVHHAKQTQTQSQQQQQPQQPQQPAPVELPFRTPFWAVALQPSADAALPAAAPAAAAAVAQAAAASSSSYAADPAAAAAAQEALPGAGPSGSSSSSSSGASLDAAAAAAVPASSAAAAGLPPDVKQALTKRASMLAQMFGGVYKQQHELVIGAPIAAPHAAGAAGPAAPAAAATADSPAAAAAAAGADASEDPISVGLRNLRALLGARLSPEAADELAMSMVTTNLHRHVQSGAYSEAQIQWSRDLRRITGARTRPAPAPQVIGLVEGAPQTPEEEALLRLQQQQAAGGAAAGAAPAAALDAAAGPAAGAGGALAEVRAAQQQVLAQQRQLVARLLALPPAKDIEESMARSHAVWELRGRLTELQAREAEILAELQPQALREAAPSEAEVRRALRAEERLKRRREAAPAAQAAEPAAAAAVHRTPEQLDLLELQELLGGASSTAPAASQQQPAAAADAAEQRQAQAAERQGVQHRQQQQQQQPGRLSDWVRKLGQKLGMQSAQEAAAAAAAAEQQRQMAAELQQQAAESAAAAAAAAEQQRQMAAELQQQAAESAASAAAADAAGGAAGGRRPRLFGQPAAAAEAQQQAAVPQEPKQVLIPEQVSVKQLAALLSTTPAQLEAVLTQQLGETVRSSEDVVPAEVAELAAMEFNCVALTEQGSHTLAPRPAVVTIMGHVDHGKTSLLDALRNSNVVASEAGGITQHIGAFEVQLPGSQETLTFIDTPGHAAFSSMRARGAAVTDIVVLVVSADEGVKPQTREALAHARSAGCPIVVALTKCDLPTARPDVVKQQLVTEGLELEEFGGTVQLVHTSARSGEGLTELAEALQLQAEIMELRAAPDAPAIATVVEATMGRQGPQATVVVRRGHLRVGDPVVVGTEYGKVRALRSSTGQPAPADGVAPGHHALLIGLRGLPQAGDEVAAVADDSRAKAIARARADRADDYRRLQMASALHAQRQREAGAAAAAEAAARRRELRGRMMALLAERKNRTAARLAQLSEEYRRAAGDAAPDSLLAQQRQQAQEAAAEAAANSAAGEADAVAVGPQEEVRLVIKADVQGSVEAVAAMAAELQTQNVTIKVLFAGVGPISQSDVNLAAAAGAHLVAFNIGAPTDASVRSALSATGMRVLQHNVIYHLMDQIKGLVEGAAPYIEVEEVAGTATILATFPLSSKKAEGGKAAGVRVENGALHRTAAVFRVVRDGEVVWQGPCSSLRRHKLDVDSVGTGTECGVVLDGGDFSGFEPGDTIVCVQRVSRKAGSSAASA